MNARSVATRVLIGFSVLTVIFTDCGSASARFFGNRPEVGGPEEAQRSRELAARSLDVISQIYRGLAEYENKQDAGSINGLLVESALILRDLSSGYEDLAKGGRDLKLSPEHAVKQMPETENVLRFFGQSPLELQSLSAVALRMAEEERMLAETLEKTRFDGQNDPATALALYDALERLLYLAAAYAKVNETAQ